MTFILMTIAGAIMFLFGYSTGKTRGINIGRSEVINEDIIRLKRERKDTMKSAKILQLDMGRPSHRPKVLAQDSEGNFTVPLKPC
jgi:hypothetical protein